MHQTFTRFGITIILAAITSVGAAAWPSGAGGTTTGTPPWATAEDSGLAPTSVSPQPVRDQYGIPYGPEPQQVLDLRLPDPIAHRGVRPVIVYVHSGGWVAGTRGSVPDVALAQVARGYALVSIDYELATVGADGQPVASFPGAIWDVKRAIRYVKANARAWNVDPRALILMGASAGGHLAALVGATAGRFEPPDLPTTATRRIDSSVEAIVDLVGPSDLETFERTDHPWAAPLTASFLGCAAPSGDNLVTCRDGIVRAASVAPYVDSTDPPIFLAYGALDTLVVAGTQGEPLARLWVRAHHGNPASATYDVVEGAGHTLPFEDTVAPLSDFFDRVTQGPIARSRV